MFVVPLLSSPFSKRLDEFVSCVRVGYNRCLCFLRADAEPISFTDPIFPPLVQLPQSRSPQGDFEDTQPSTGITIPSLRDSVGETPSILLMDRGGPLRVPDPPTPPTVSDEKWYTYIYLYMYM